MSGDRFVLMKKFPDYPARIIALAVRRAMINPNDYTLAESIKWALRYPQLVKAELEKIALRQNNGPL